MLLNIHKQLLIQLKKTMYDLPIICNASFSALQEETAIGNALAEKIAYSYKCSWKKNRRSVRISIADSSLCQLSRCCSHIYVWWCGWQPLHNGTLLCFMRNGFSSLGWTKITLLWQLRSRVFFQIYAAYKTINYAYSSHPLFSNKYFSQISSHFNINRDSKLWMKC